MKHGGSQVSIAYELSSTKAPCVILTGDAGGLGDEVKLFLNSEKSFSRTEIPGSGLGLALIKGLAEVCGATIEVVGILNNSIVTGLKFVMVFQHSPM
ncbi:MAG: ATP-binding protein [Candidatus Thorarchaeota archaeon]|nr:ATP-binding protein [Candidatus Thorarchaeota archaeon]